MSRPPGLRVLLVEDNGADALLIERELARIEPGARTARVQDRAGLSAALREFHPDIVLADYRLPTFGGLDAVRFVAAESPATPVIIVTGTLDEETAVDCIKEGAADYVLKDRLVRLGPALRSALALKRSREERALAEAAVRTSERRFRALIEHSADGIALLAADGTVLYCSPASTRIIGFPVERIVGRPASDFVHPDDLAGFQAVFERVRRQPGHTETLSARARHQDGGWRHLEGVMTNLFEDPNVGAIVNNFRDVTERWLTLQELQQSEAKYRVLFASNPEAMWVYDQETLRFLAVNDTAVARYGWSREEFLALTIHDIRAADEHDRLSAILQEHAGTDQPVTLGGVRHRRKDGSLLDVEILVHPLTFASRPARLVLAKDVTERLRLEQQLRQAQKMEGIGRLAGGVAHDFNNILTAIIGSADLLLEELPAGAPSIEDVQEIRRAAQRAANLTRQLLAFSRQQVLAPRVLDLNAVVTGVEQMLRRLIGENIELRVALGGAVGTVRADPGQLEQVILNLAVNARDAMPHGGKLTIETANVDLDGSYARGHVTVRPGPYVLLAVADTGHGMDEVTRAHLFEPFYTTKEMGRGTGLGLATVYGIVKQSGGYIWVYSEPRHGATFKIYLPRMDAPAEPADAADAAAPEPRRGSETILLVEDEELVRSLARRVLMQQGYTVLEAPTGLAALAAAAAHDGDIHLLLTDVVMPGLGGRELARQLARQRPATRVLYLSGYSDDAVVQHGMLDPGTAFLQKPFTPAALLRKVAEVLDAAR